MNRVRDTSNAFISNNSCYKDVMTRTWVENPKPSSHIVTQESQAGLVARCFSSGTETKQGPQPIGRHVSGTSRN